MTPNRILGRATWLACAAWLLLSGSIYGQVTQPAPAAEYDVQIRFRLRAPMPKWLDLFDQLVADLKALGFQRQPRPADEAEDPDSDRLTGVIGSANARKILLHPYVQTIVIAPRGFKPPTAADQRVKVSLELATGLPKDRQHVLSDQVVQQLDQIGFREAIGYDHRGYTRVLGTIDAFHLDNLLRDLRGEPSGWLVPRTAVNTLPSPLRNVVPIRVVEILPEPSDVPPAQEPAPAALFPEGQTHLAKIAPELRAILAHEKDDQKKIRLEVVLSNAPVEFDRDWERELRLAAVGVAIEGRIGNVVTVLARMLQVPNVARPPAVLAVRLPRVGEERTRRSEGEAVDALNETRLGRFHQHGYRGNGVKVAVIAGDFGGYQRFLGNRLPKDTALIDFTAARNQSLLPDPMPSDDGRLGQGTLCALAVRLAAPEAPIMLVRIDPAAPYQLLTIARIINDDPYSVDALEDRRKELDRDSDVLARRRLELQDERRKALDGLIFEEGDSKLPELKKRYEESHARLKKVLQDLENLKKDDAEQHKRIHRYLGMREELSALKNVRVVVSALVWNDGHPLDGASELSRYFDERPFVGYAGDASRTRIASLRSNRGTLWVQAAGDTRGQTWAGLFRDDDNDGAMEFAPLSQPLGPGRWTPELNFLAWQPYEGAQVADLPEKVRVRVSMQWREPHDPALYNQLDDAYRDPLLNAGLVIMRQRDPRGTKLATDDLEVLARTTSPAVRLNVTPTSGVYEQSIEFEATAGGRLALRVEGRVPNTMRPAGFPSVPGQRRVFEIRPRIFVEVVDPVAGAMGRVVFLDYGGDAHWPTEAPSFTGWSQFGGVGMPADARNVLSVGAAGREGKATASSAVGAGPGREMLVKPDVLGFGALDLGTGIRGSGTSIAAAYNGGVAACLIAGQAPAQPRSLLQLLQLPPGAVLKIPDAWLETGKNR